MASTTTSSAPRANAGLASADPLEELSAIVRAHRGRLLAVARAEGLGPEDALECVQDALSTFVSRERDGAVPDDEAGGGADAGDRTLVATVLAMVRNAARNGRRRHHRLRPHHSLEEHEVVGSEPSPELALLHAEETVRLRQCVAELCGVQRAVVTLRLLEERSGEDVAAELGVSRGYVDVIVHRAKASLRVCMREPKHRGS